MDLSGIRLASESGKTNTFGLAEVVAWNFDPNDFTEWHHHLQEIVFGHFVIDFPDLDGDGIDNLNVVILFVTFLQLSQFGCHVERLLLREAHVSQLPVLIDLSEVLIGLVELFHKCLHFLAADVCLGTLFHVGL